MCCIHRLGDYSHDNFDDDRVNVPLAKFKAALDDIEEDLTET